MEQKGKSAHLGHIWQQLDGGQAGAEVRHVHPLVGTTRGRGQGPGLGCAGCDLPIPCATVEPSPGNGVKKRAPSPRRALAPTHQLIPGSPLSWASPNCLHPWASSLPWWHPGEGASVPYLLGTGSRRGAGTRTPPSEHGALAALSALVFFCGD